MATTESLTATPEMARVAREWFEYVSNRERWSDATWEAAAERKLAVRRVKHRNDGEAEGHFWTLTEEGLDLFAAGRSVVR
jgi:hypothetical protein